MNGVATTALVVGGGAVGAVTRHLAETVVARGGRDFPWGTFVVNVVGSFVLGLVVGAASGDPRDSAFVLLVGVGFCGALTTYSGFAYQVVALGSGRGVGRSRRRAAVYVVASTVGAVAAAALGHALAA